jgi:hypothetical protein
MLSFLKAIPIGLVLIMVPAGFARADTSADALTTHFKTIWSSDQCVQQRGQAWEDYQGWVVRFYSGSDGWLAMMDSLTQNITDATVRARRKSELAKLGVRVAGEWSKDNACRKIRTAAGLMNADEDGKPDLATWRDALNQAAAADSGDGAMLETAIRRITGQVNALAIPPI